MEAATNAMLSTMPSYGDPTTGDYAEEALKAADAVPLPSDEELTEMLAKALSLSSGINDWFKDDAIASFIPDAKAAIAALRPWLASMIEKGRKPDAVNTQKKSFPENTHYDSNGYCDNPARGF